MKKMRWVAMIALAAAFLTSVTPTASAAPTLTNRVHNTGDYYIGALSSLAGPHKNGNYDDLIPPGAYSGYTYTAGIYIGPGFCGRFRSWTADGGLNPPWVIQGPYTVDLGVASGWDVRALPLDNDLCKHV